MDNQREPDFAAIVGSDIWRDEIRPWLEQLLEDTHLDMETETGAEEYREKQGYCRALRAVVNMPQYMVELRRKEQEDAGRAGSDNRPAKRWFGRR